MPIPDEYKAPFACNQYYHFLFRSIDGIPLFKSNKERFFFLEKWKRFTTTLLNTWAYCLIDNHVHIIGKMKAEQEIEHNLFFLPVELRTSAIRNFLNEKSLQAFESVVERQINSFMVSYSNTYNNVIERKGGVFQQPFRRSIIADESHLQQAIVYVHANAQKHGLVNDFKRHNHNSYHTILDGNETFISTKAVIEFFGGIDKFISIHKEQVAYFYSRQWPNSKLEIE
ncbi:MAG: hypothetical protein GXC73_02990 [Chitinophagaceae bacterium]|nr:hypothetical protein [Chitinophagaceae bacterium]